jgi:hypothetical protein
MDVTGVKSATSVKNPASARLFRRPLPARLGSVTREAAGREGSDRVSATGGAGRPAGMVPAETDAENVYVTAGTLDAPLGRGVRIHIFCASRADWDADEPDSRFLDERPSWTRTALAGVPQVR